MLLLFNMQFAVISPPWSINLWLVLTRVLKGVLSAQRKATMIHFSLSSQSKHTQPRQTKYSIAVEMTISDLEKSHTVPGGTVTK